jgi:FkbM family methyltransferase
MSEPSAVTRGLRVKTLDVPRLLRAAARLRRRALAAYRRQVQPQIISHHGIRLPLTEAVSQEMRATLYTGSYEEREYEVLSSLLDASDHVLELGSGLGFITVLCALRCGSERVTSVEANPHMLSTLRTTFLCNGVSPRLVQGAVSAQGNAQTLFVSQNFWSSSTHDRGGKPTLVPGVAFEDLLAQYQPTVLVIDIEGGEAALTSATIAPGVRAIVIELHEGVTGAEAAERVRGWIAGHGFHSTHDWGNRSVVVFERSGAARG